jgi:hypothetical protein
MTRRHPFAAPVLLVALLAGCGGTSEPTTRHEPDGDECVQIDDEWVEVDDGDPCDDGHRIVVHRETLRSTSRTIGRATSTTRPAVRPASPDVAERRMVRAPRAEREETATGRRSGRRR